jgi:hypothetical protein
MPDSGVRVRRLHRDGVKSRTKKVNAATGRAIHLRYTLELPERAKLAARHLRLVNETFARLFADENFLTLLRAESIPTIPVYRSHCSTSKTLCIDQLGVTICCRYIESLLKAPLINRYLAKHHQDDLCKLRNLLDEFEQICLASHYDRPVQ